MATQLRDTAGLERRPLEATLALAAAWLAFVAGLLLGAEVEDAGSFAIGVAAGAVLVLVGFAAAWRVRVVPPRTEAQRLRLALLSLAAGVALGLANLGANVIISLRHPDIHAVLTKRMRALEPLQGVVAAPLLEEVLVRVFLMSAIAWVVFWFTKRATLAFAIGLVGSALVFALLHLGRPFPGDPTLANYYATTLVIKYTLAGVALGWIFWRWGLPYSILCHSAANAAHLAAQQRFF